MNTQINPYQSPALSPVVMPGGIPDRPTYFQGSMTVEEGQQVDGLTQRKKPRPQINWAKWAFIDVIVVGVLGYFVYEMYVYDELDHLFEFLLGIVLIGVILFANHMGTRQKKNQIAALKDEERGVFTNIAGRIGCSGVDFLADDFPVQYEWNDFVGCRVGEDVVLLYVDFPSEYNFLAASWFASPEEWGVAKELVAMHVQNIPQPTRWAPRAHNPKMTHIASGVGYLNGHLWQEALAEFDQALSIDPSNSQALRGRAVALVAMRELETALSCIGMIVGQGTLDATTRRMRATALIATEQYEMALDDLNILIELIPDDPDLLRDRGLVFLKVGRLPEALRDATAALERNPGDAVVYNNRGATLIQLGQPEEAIADLEKAIAIEPNFDRPHIHLAKAKEMLGHAAESY